MGEAVDYYMGEAVDYCIRITRQLLKAFFKLSEERVIKSSPGSHYFPAKHRSLAPKASRRLPDRQYSIPMTQVHTADPSEYIRPNLLIDPREFPINAPIITYKYKNLNL